MNGFSELADFFKMFFKVFLHVCNRGETGSGQVSSMMPSKVSIFTNLGASADGAPEDTRMSWRKIEQFWARDVLK